MMAVGSAFATFSGEAKIEAGLNLDNGNFGFLDQSNTLKLDVDFSTLDVDTTPVETVAEDGTVTPVPSVYASVKASLRAWLFNGEKGSAADDPMGDVKPFVAVDLAEATIGGENWSVSILEMPGMADYATSAIDTYTVKGKVDDYGFTKADFDGNYSYSAAFAKAPGVKADIFGYTVGLGVKGDLNGFTLDGLKDSMNVAAYVATPEYDFSGLTAQVAAGYSYKSVADLARITMLLPLILISRCLLRQSKRSRRLLMTLKRILKLRSMLSQLHLQWILKTTRIRSMLS